MQVESGSIARPIQQHGGASGLADVATLPALLRWRVGLTPDSEAYRHFDPAQARWVSFTWREIDAEIGRWRRALAAEAFAPGERVAILMPNSIAHIAMDQAIMARGLVPVPMHAVDNPDSIVYILRDCGARLLFIDSGAHWLELAADTGALPELARVVCADLSETPELAAGDPRIIALDRWLAAAPNAPALPDVALTPDDLAAIVYTSGTTGRPKGVMLSHGNVVSNIKATHQQLAASADDLFLSFLPLSHTFERTGGYYYPIAVGACVAYARSVKQLAEDLVQVRPTILVSVPRIYERIYSLVMHHRAIANIAERALLDLTLAVGGRRFDARQSGAALSLPDRLVWPILQRMVARTVLNRFGGRLKVAVSGGAPIAEPVIRLFLALGLDVLQGYGMTETSPVVSANTIDDNDPRSVGHALPGIEVRIGDNEELMVRGPSVMVGYWNKPEETARIKEADGWLHTGDQARIDAEGRITITGRIKDILVTSTGEKIAPADLETAILTDPLFEQAIVIGENRPFLSAIVVLNPKGWAEQQARLAAHGQVGPDAEAASLLRHIARTVKTYPAYATPKAVHWTLEPWTIQAGLITPTLKNKRPAIERTYAAEIEAIYGKRTGTAKPAAAVVNR